MVSRMKYLKYMQIRSQLTKFLGEAANTPKLTDTEVSLESMVKHKYKIIIQNDK